MRENKSLFVVAALAIALYALIAILTAQYEGTRAPSEQPAPTATAPRPLNIAYVSPTGDISRPTPISVAFDRPMVLPEKIGVESPTGPIAFSPPIAGTFTWIGQSLLTFQPKRDLPIATNFTATIPASVRAMSGECLAKNYTWTFATPGLGVVRHRMDYGIQDVVARRPKLLLEFNQPVALEAVRKCAALLKTNTSEKAPFTAARPEKGEVEEGASVEHVVVLQPTSELPHGSNWQWVLLGDLTGKSGPRPLGRRWARGFRVCPHFAVRGIEGFAESDGTTGIRMRFTNRIDPKSIPEKTAPFQISPSVKIHSCYQDYEGAVLVGAFETEHEYAVTIPDSIRDEFGNTLGREMTCKVKIPDYEPAIAFSGYRGYIERMGPKEFSMAVVNLPVIGIELFKIDEQDVVPYLMEARKEGDKAWPEGHSRTGVFRRMTGTAGEEKFKRTVVPMSWILREDEGGFVFLRARAKLDEKRIKGDEKAFLTQEAVLQVTDIGITCKASPENTLIWATSLHSAEPLPGVSLCMRNGENKVIWKGVTDENGMAVGLGVDMSYDAAPTFLIAKNEQDLAYLALDSEQIGLWQFSISRDWEPTPHRTIAHLFTDRGLYKGGETVHVKGIVRVDTEKGITVPDKKSAHVTVHDPRGKEVLAQTVSLSDLGTFSLDVKLNKNTALGQYWVYARLPGHPESDSESGAFQVAAFRPAEFEVEVLPEQKEYSCGDKLRARAEARYLFGAPMKDARIEWNAYWEDAWFRPAGCDEFRFGDMAGYYDYRARVEREIESGEGTLGEDGGAVIEVPLQPKNRIACTLQCHLSVTATDRSHQSVSGGASVMVHPADFYLGVKTHSYILTANKATPFQFIAVTPDGKRVGNFPMKVRVVKRQWHTVRKKTVWSDYHYESEAVDETVASTTLQMTEQGALWSFTPPSSGSFFIEVSAMDPKDRIARTVSQFCATGTDYVAWQRDDKNTVELVADKDEYAVGDTARVLIKSPYEKAKAVLTIERQGIMEQRLLDLTSTAPTVDVPIKRECLPNVYASVVLIQGRTSEKFSEAGADLGKPTYRAGYINLPVRNEAARLTVGVKPNRATAQPGDKITVDVRVTDKDGKGRKAEVALIAADEGVLKLIAYPTPDPVAAIYRPRPLAVETCETRRSIIGRTRFDWLGRKGTSPGDKGQGGAILSGVDLFRKRFFYTAYYNPALMTDENGRASASFELPDNLTRFRLMAVAVSADNFLGSGEAEVEVKKPILIRPALPRFVNASDEFIARALVHNYTGEARKVSTKIETEGQVELVKESTKDLTLAPNESAPIEFPVKAADPGEAAFRFSARSGEHGDGVEIIIPVNYPAVYLTTIKEGSTEGTAKAPIRPPEAYRGDVGEVEVTVSASRLCELGESVAYLLQYPYGCIEQTSSPTLVLAALKDLLPAIASSGLKAKDIDERVEHGIHRLLSMQHYDGGFGYWPNAPDAQPWSSGYATFTLLACQRAGYGVPEDDFNRATDYLAGFLRSNVDDNRYVDKATRCMMLYTLACAGKPELAYHELLAREADALPVFAKAFLAMAIHKANPNDPLLPRLLASLNNYADGKPAPAPDRDQAEQLALIMDSDTRTSAIVLSALTQIDPKSRRIERLVRALMHRRKQGRWMSTQENAFCLLALADYASGREAAPPDFVANVKLGDRLLGMKRFASHAAPVLSITVSLREVVAAGSRLLIEKEGKGKLFYTIKTRFLPIKTDRPPVDKGFQVTRRYQPFDGLGAKASQRYKAGDLIKVHLTIATPASRHYVAVEDPLPAGLEAVNTHFATADPKINLNLPEGWSQFNYTEKRDDRVLLFADWLPAGVHEHVYVARATTPGTFAMPAVHVEEMYSPTVCGESESSRVVIEAKAK